MQSYSSVNDPANTRTLNQIKSDFQNFVQKGGQNIKVAFKLSNVIRESLLDIPLTQVSPPILRILLGVVKKHHTILEESCDSLDIDIIDDLLDNHHTLVDVSDSLKHVIKKASKIKSKIKVNKRNLKSTKDEIMRNEIKAAIEYLKTEKKILDSKYPKRKGPVCSELDVALKKNKIELQAYHGRSFIGNHANKY